MVDQRPLIAAQLSEMTAIAAYNRGEGGLGRDIQYSRSLDFDSLAGRNALPNETHHYVPKFMACVLIGEHPEKYGLHPQ